MAGLPINLHVTLSLLADRFSFMEPGYLGKGFWKHLTGNFCVPVRFNWYFGASHIHGGCSPWSKADNDPQPYLALHKAELNDSLLKYCNPL